MRRMSGSSPWYREGLSFECTQCGNCCAGGEPGYVWVTKKEVDRLARHLGLTQDAFGARFLRRVGGALLARREAGVRLRFLGGGLHRLRSASDAVPDVFRSGPRTCGVGRIGTRSRTSVPAWGAERSIPSRRSCGFDAVRRRPPRMLRSGARAWIGLGLGLGLVACSGREPRRCFGSRIHARVGASCGGGGDPRPGRRSVRGRARRGADPLGGPASASSLGSRSGSMGDGDHRRLKSLRSAPSSRGRFSSRDWRLERDARVRVEVARALARLPRGGEQWLAAAVSDRDAKVRAASGALAVARGELEAVRELLGDREPSVRRAAALALARRPRASPAPRP